MSETAELVSSIRLSDPLPSGCSACMRSAGPDVRFVDFRAAFDAGAIVGPSQEVIRSLDELHLCESCVRSAAEVLAYKPQFHAEQIRRIRMMEVERDHWRSTADRERKETDRLREHVRRVEQFQDTGVRHRGR